MKSLEPLHPDPRRRGFTLIELLAVLLILGILVGFLVSQLGRSSELAKERLTRAKLAELGAAVESFERREGDWPQSAFRAEDGAPPNGTNLGAEALVLAFFSNGRGGLGLSADDLVNTDGDQASKALTDLPTNDLFEFADLWGNPIAYFHHQDYGRVDRYVTFDPSTGEERESEVRALQNPTTRQPYQSGRFQLLSAGPDGEFGTEDDVSHFARDR